MLLNMLEHVYLTPRFQTARLNRQRSVQVIFPARWSCLVALSALFFFCQSFKSKIPTQRKHTLISSARSTKHLCWLHAKSNTCESHPSWPLARKNTCTAVIRPGDLPKIVALNTCAIYNADSERKICDTYL